MNAPAPRSDVCSKCAAPLLWAATVNGKMQPLDADPNPAGNIRLTGGFKATKRGALPACAVIPKAELEPSLLPAVVEDRYMPHHATCPNADEFRRQARAS